MDKEVLRLSKTEREPRSDPDPIQIRSAQHRLGHPAAVGHPPGRHRRQYVVPKIVGRNKESIPSSHTHLIRTAPDLGHSAEPLLGRLTFADNTGQGVGHNAGFRSRGSSFWSSSSCRLWQPTGAQCLDLSTIYPSCQSSYKSARDDTQPDTSSEGTRSYRIWTVTVEEMASSDDQLADAETGRSTVTPLSPSSIEREQRSSVELDPTLYLDEPKSSHKFLQWTQRVEHFLGLEARGIHRVKANEQTAKTTLGFWQIVILWLSINTAPQNIILGSIGRGVYELGFVDATLCAVFGGTLGCVPTAYTAGWGPWSGNRTIIGARFSMGWWPVKICVLLNLVILIGYAMTDAVIAGQMLSAVSPHGSLTVEVGIVVTAVITWAFRIKIFHHFERYAFIPQTLALLALAGTAGPKFDTSSPSAVTGATLSGNRLTFFSISLSAAVFAATLLGLSLSFAFTFTLGAGLASGLENDPTWEAAGSGSGALVVAGYNGLGGFGKFCAVLSALGLIANMVPPIYISGINFQILGRWFALVPRFLWTTFACVVSAVCALAGKDSLSAIFTNFLALMGYWVVILIAITLEEEFVFRRRGPGFIWSDWSRQEKLPIGIAALVSFCVGWVGSVLCMAQFYFIGPIAVLVGEYGADMGNYVGFAWAIMVYPPLRYWELKMFGR
ncbi:hypothetical protein LZ554_008302 [Drepanopeziza brunnea f. sp. 'monogermtubi']|nr:hypothetical protein LZ554_008302 [Drepanopeziza brunnea f. sp. 'monogermtubi']